MCWGSIISDCMSEQDLCVHTGECLVLHALLQMLCVCVWSHDGCMTADVCVCGHMMAAWLQMLCVCLWSHDGCMTADVVCIWWVHDGWMTADVVCVCGHMMAAWLQMLWSHDGCMTAGVVCIWWVHDGAFLRHCVCLWSELWASVCVGQCVVLFGNSHSRRMYVQSQNQKTFHK